MISKFLEYLSLIPAGLKNPEAVLEGVVNSVKMKYDKLPEDEQSEIVRRRLICQACPYTSSNAITNPALNYKTHRVDEHCILCHCPIETKTASLQSNCGIEIRNKNNPNHQLPLRWEVYKPTTNDQTN
jgi:hypothetical protein